MYPNEIMISAKFDKSLPEGRREHTLRKLKYFFTIYADSRNKSIHTGARPMEIRGVPGVYKLRTSKGERILYEVSPDKNIILREYSAHDDQITRAKSMAKNESGGVPLASLFDAPENEFNQNKIGTVKKDEFEQYEVEPANDRPLIIEQTEIIIATDEWITQCENTQDYIWLASKEQAEIISANQYPQFISGSAGTGKTTVLFQKLCALAQNKGKILYITMSSVLKEDFQRIYEKFKPKQEVAQISFLTIDELYRIHLPDHKKIATQEQFLAEFSPICQRMNTDPQDVWCEIEGIIKSHLGLTVETTISFLNQILNSAYTTLSSKNYCNVKAKYSYFSLESRNMIHDIATRYDSWLAAGDLLDINQLAAQIINSGAKQKYDLIMVDEVQDFTELQLYLIMQLAKSATQIIFCGDINQNVRPTFFMFERLYNIYYSLGCKNAKGNMYTLTKNYRSCKEIVLLLNRILDEQGQRIGFQGSKEDEGIHETGFRDGSRPLFLESSGENLNKILSAIFDKHYAIAITPDEKTQNSLAAYFPEAKGRIFTVREAKGLEYNVVFTVNMTSAYEKEWQRIVNGNEIKRKRRFRRFFGYIYVAASRARYHLGIIEEKGCSFLKLVDGTYETLEEWDLGKVGLAAQSTAGDFEKDANKLEKAGLTDKAEAAREMAKRIRETKEPEPDTIPIREETAGQAQESLKRLTKRLYIQEVKGKQCVVSENGNILIKPHDSISFSPYRDDNGRSVFECHLNQKIIYYDQNGNIFKPGSPEPWAKAKQHWEKVKQNKKKVTMIAASLALLAICTMFISIVYSHQIWLLINNPTAGFKPHEPISEVIKGDIVQVCAGHNHSAALTKDGSVWTWGNNLYDVRAGSYKMFKGQYYLLINSRRKIIQPVIKKVDINDVVYIDAGNYLNAAIKKDGSLWTWGYNAYGALGNGIDFAIRGKIFGIDSNPYKIMDDVKSVSLGDLWGLAVKKDGTLWSWGINDYGNLGNGTTGHSCEPVKIMDDVISASAGKEHGIALKKDDTVWIWGSNLNGQLGNADNKVKYVNKPQKVMEGVSYISAGFLNSSVIKKDGSLWTWGSTRDGRATKPKQMLADNSAGINMSDDGNNMPLMLSSTGKLYSWAVEEGRLLLLLDSVVQVSMFSHHYLALKDDGSIWAFGNNDYGQLGDGTLEERNTPTMVYQNDNDREFSSDT